MTATRTQLCSLTAAALIGIGGCTGMSSQDRNTLMGAGVGGAAGAILTDGSAGGTIGGAAAGGIIGHVMTPDDDYRTGNGRYRDNGYDDRRRYDNRGRWNNSNGYDNGYENRYDNSYDYSRSQNSDWH